MTTATTPTIDVQQLLIANCHPSPMNRRHIDPKSQDMLELGASIRSKGVLQPGVARPHPDKGDGEYPDTIDKKYDPVLQAKMHQEDIKAQKYLEELFAKLYPGKVFE